MIRVPRAARSASSLINTKWSRHFSNQTSRMSSGKSSLDADKGSVGSAFKPEGSIGSKAQEVGGPFDKDGTIGKQFKTDGAVGSTAQSAAEQAQGDNPSVFDKDGAVGKLFKADGAIGNVGEAVGGPFSKDGAVGKQFSPDGSVGGTVQENLGKSK